MIKNILIAVFAIGTLAGVAVSSFLFLRYSSSRPIMRVGSEVITRKEFQERMEYVTGKAILNKLAYRKLIMQAAQKANVMPTQKDVDERIADIERRTPALLEAAKRDSVKMEDLREDMLGDIAFENLRVKDIKLTDGDVARFYDSHKTLFGVPAQAQTTLVVAQNSVDADTAKGLLAQNIKPETIARQPRLAVVGVNGFQINANQIPPELSKRLEQAVFSMKEGDIVSVPAGANFLVIRLNKRAISGIPALDSIRPLVARMAKLAQAPAPDLVLTQLYKDANVVFEVGKYSDYFSDIQTKIKETKINETKPNLDKKIGATGTPAASTFATARP